jgi:hypothetical protein
MIHTTRTLRSASVTAGLALALMALLAAFGVFGATAALVTPGDAAKTVQDISGSQTLSMSALAAWFRIAYAAVYLVAILQLVLALSLLSEPEQALRAIEAYNTIWLVGLILFGVHLLLIGYLAYRSGFIAKVFGILLVVAGLGYIADGFVAVLVAGPSISVGQFTFVGEVAFIFWLLIVGRRKSFSTDGTDQPHSLDPFAPVSTAGQINPGDRRPVDAWETS